MEMVCVIMKKPIVLGMNLYKNIVFIPLHLLKKKITSSLQIVDNDITDKLNMKMMRCFSRFQKENSPENITNPYEEYRDVSIDMAIVNDK